MDGLSAAASVIAVIQITSAIIGYLDNVKGAEEAYKRLYDELWAIYGILSMLESQLNKNIESWSPTLHWLGAPNGPIKQIHRALQTLSTKLAPAQGAKKLQKKLAWPFKQTEIMDTFAIIERQKGILLLARQNDHIKLAEAIKANTASMRQQVSSINTGLAQIQLNRSQDDICRWLSAPDPSINYQRALKSRHSGTGAWLLGELAFLRWKNEPGSLLWLYGIPGCGKTILSSTILEDVLRLCQTNHRTAVLYFYFDFYDSEKQGHENMARSLVSQLYCRNSNVPEALDLLYKSCEAGKRQPSHDTLLTTLHQMMRGFDEVYVVLDALDECSDRSYLLDDIEEFSCWKDVRLHLLTTSRRESDLDSCLRPLCKENMYICVESAVVNADIRSYVLARLQKDRALKRWYRQPQIQKEIEVNLMMRANGMFRWAVCQLDSLAKCISVNQLRQELQSLPKDLDGTYERIISRIDDMHKRSAVKILQWLAFSTRPLKFEELVETVTIDVHANPRIDSTKRLYDPLDLLIVCSSLITLETDPVGAEKYSPGSDSSQDYDLGYESSGSSEYDWSPYESSSIRLAHFSVKEYLMSDRIRSSGASSFSIQELHSHTVIAEDCLAYLLQFTSDKEFDHQSIDKNKGPERRMWLTQDDNTRFPLAQYAATFWRVHFRMTKDGDTGTLHRLTLQFFLTSGAEFRNWVWLCRQDPFKTLGRPREDSDTTFSHTQLNSPLHWASLLGLPSVVSSLLASDLTTMEAVDAGKRISPLYAACCGADAETVRILLDNGADVHFNNDTKPEPTQALYMASSSGFKNIVQLLLAYGANIDASGGRFGSAIHTAAFYGHNEVVLMLLEKGADLCAQSRILGSVLQAASFYSNKEVIEAIIAKGVDVNSQGGQHGTALQIASNRRSYAVIRLLVEKGAEVNTSDSLHETPLQHASAWGDKKLVSLLLAKGAEVNAPWNRNDARHSTALYLATKYGSCDVIRLLLLHGAEVNALGGTMGTALQVALIRQDTSTVHLLLENRADVNVRGGRFATALQTASAHIQLDNVKLLLSKGADVNAYGGRYGTALEASIWEGNHPHRERRKKLKEVLLANGAKSLDEIEAELIARGEQDLVLRERAERLKTQDSERPWVSWIRFID